MLKETLRQIRPASRGKTPRREAEGSRELRAVLVGNVDREWELPALSELVTAALALAAGRRSKAIIPLGRTAAEFSLVRRGDRVAIGCYSTETLPEVLAPDREIALRKLLEVCAKAARSAAQADPESAAGRAMLKLAERASAARIGVDPRRGRLPVTASGGAIEDPGEQVPLAFGFEVSIPTGADAFHAARWFADVHALLFPGELWAWSRGKRIPLFSGPIMPAAQRMVAAARALVEGWQADRPLNVRLRGDKFLVGVRLAPGGEVHLTLGHDGQGAVTITALEVRSAALPILRLVADLLRALVHADRAQSRNLRVAALRGEVRALRRAVQARNRLDSFENRDPERLLLASDEPRTACEPAAPLARTQTGRLRFVQRWSAEIDGLDAASTFLCGDRLVVATPKLTLALGRDRGEVLWSQPAVRASYFMASKALLRLLDSGEVQLCDLERGEVYAGCRIANPSAGDRFALFGGGGGAPPVAIMAEGRQRLVAIDLRTGEPRWRFAARGAGPFQLRRAGRVVLAACGAGSIDALEVASGEPVWRFADQARFCLSPAVCGQVVVAASGEPGAAAGALYGIDLYSGRRLWRSELETAPGAAPLDAGSIAVLPLGAPRRGVLAGFDPVAAAALWNRPDPGVGAGGSAISVDRALIINTPSGLVSALDLDSGQTLWSRSLSDPLTDDVPRQLEPVLRHGALFVPAARVHVLRPSDGASLSAEMPCDLVPDWMRVDERGWLYVAEESGHLRAYAPAPHLSLVR